MKKLLSIILSVAMLLTMFAGVTAFAEETEVTVDKTLTKSGLTIEFEDYAIAEGDIRKSSNGAVFVDYGWTGQTEAVRDVVIEVTEPGFYDAEVVMGHGVAPDAYGKTVVKLVDEEKTTLVEFDNLSTNGTVLNGEYDDYMAPYMAPTYKYETKKVWLDTGIYTLKTTPGSNGATYAIRVDYIKFTKSDYKKISSSEKTRIEFEDVEPRLKTETQNVSGGAVIYSGWTDINQIKIPVTIEKEGYYTIEQLAGKGTSTDYSWWTMYIDDVQYATRMDESVATAADLGYTNSSSELPLVLFRENSKWLTAGDHIIKYEFSSVNGHYGMNMDYLEFIPKGGRRIISGTQPTVIEYEDFAVYNGHIISTPEASGGKFLSDGWGSVNPSVNIFVETEKAGLYWIEVLQGYAKDTSSYGLKHTWMVNDVGDEVGFAYSDNAAGDLDNTFTTTYTTYGINGASGMPVKKFRSLIWLPQGRNTIRTKVGAANGTYKYNLDAIILIPVDGIEVNGEDVTVTANWKTAYTGKAYAALYNGEELVNVAEMDVTDAKEIKMTLKETDSFDKAKIFVWDVVNDNTPLTKARIFTK